MPPKSFIHGFSQCSLRPTSAPGEQSQSMLICAQRCTQSLRPAAKNTKKAKGVKKNVVKKHIRHEQYKETFHHGINV